MTYAKTNKKKTMTTETIRFRHIDADDIIYVGTVEITEDTADWGEPTTEVTILDCWRFGTTVEEVFPYEKNFPTQLRLEIIQTAKEQRMTPPATPVELPTDWDAMEVVDAETEYKIRIAAALPRVESDMEAKAHGLSAVRRIIPGGDTYTVRAKGGIDDVRRELYRVRLF